MQPSESELGVKLEGTVMDTFLSGRLKPFRLQFASVNSRFLEYSDGVTRFNVSNKISFSLATIYSGTHILIFSEYTSYGMSLPSTKALCNMAIFSRLVE